MDKKLLSQASLFCLILGVFAIFIVLWIWRFLPFQEEIEGTNQAVIKAAIIPINSSATGYVSRVYVEDYQKVAKGTPLFAIDTRLHLAELTAFKERLTLLNKEIIDLTKKGSKLFSKTIADKKVEITLLIEMIKTLSSQKEELLIKAPTDGYVNDIRVHEGQYIAEGMQLTSVVGKHLWVIAHYKETQLSIFDIGKKVFVIVDAFPKSKFPGSISAVAPGSDEALALSAPVAGDSASFGTRLKRVSVKIEFDPIQNDEMFNKLRAGMSASVRLQVTLGKNRKGRVRSHPTKI